MHAFASIRSFAVVAGLVMAGLALPSLAAKPTPISFQADNPWAQEIGNLTRDDNHNQYVVAIAAGKTLQINLVTRDPNLFFKIKSSAHHRWLVDTLKTGATTWSAAVTEPTTYTIEVYANAGTLARGSTSKYALQVGQYGVQDLQPASTTVAFQNNQAWAQYTSTVDAKATAHDYTVAIAAGQTLAVNLIAQTPSLHFTVKDDATKQVLVDTAKTASAKWSTPVATAATYTIRVYADAAAVPPGRSTGYTLQIGHYADNNTGAAATPAAAASVGPAPAVTAGAASGTQP